MGNHWTEIEKYLEDQKIAQELIGELRDFHMRYEVEDQVKERVEKPDILFYGKKILEMSIAALLQGDNLLLSGAKAPRTAFSGRRRTNGSPAETHS